MPVALEKWVTAPLEVVKQLFEERGPIADDEFWGIQRFFEDRLKTEAGRAAVPTLTGVTSDLLHDGSLVRYIGMVQDHYDPELYLKKYNTITEHGSQVNCGLYSDLTHQPPTAGEVSWEHPSNTLADRLILYCTPVPAATPWVKEMNESGCGVMEEGEDLTRSSPSHKRRLCENDEPAETVAMEEVEEEEVDEDAGIKKHCSIRAELSSPTLAGHDLNLPLPGDHGLPCLVKVYKDGDHLQVCSVVEVVGVLSVHPTLAPISYSDEGDGRTAAERRAHSPPPSLVPRVHAIIITVLHHCNPLLPTLLPASLTSLMEFFPGPECVSAIRGLVLDMLSQVLCGDRLAAEYVLLHLLSSVYGRAGILAVGKFSLNLSKCHGTHMAQDLYNLLENWLTKCFLLPLSLDNLNTWRFTPKKDYNSNRLVAGVLQLSSGTEVVVDETALIPGQLSEVGVVNLKALGNVIQFQKLSYNFEFHSAEFETDLLLLILSEGKSMLKVDCEVPVMVVSSYRQLDTCTAATPAQLSLLRSYFTLCQRLQYSLQPQMQNVLENEFVKQRHEGRGDVESGITAESFHQLLSLARLMCISHGCSSLNPRLWQLTQTLESERKQRLTHTRRNETSQQLL